MALSESEVEELLRRARIVLESDISSLTNALSTVIYSILRPKPGKQSKRSKEKSTASRQGNPIMGTLPFGIFGAFTGNLCTGDAQEKTLCL